MASSIGQYVAKALTNLSDFYRDLNPATLSGAIDVLVVEKAGGEMHGSPFHVRFGKLRLLRPSEKAIEVEVNGERTPYLMKLGEQGEAFFVFKTDKPIPDEYVTSPILQATRPEEEEDMEYFDLDGQAPPPLRPEDFESAHEFSGVEEEEEEESDHNLVVAPEKKEEGDDVGTEHKDSEGQGAFIIPPTLSPYSPDMTQISEASSAITTAAPSPAPSRPHEDGSHSDTEVSSMLLTGTNETIEDLVEVDTVGYHTKGSRGPPGTPQLLVTEASGGAWSHVSGRDRRAGSLRHARTLSDLTQSTGFTPGNLESLGLRDTPAMGSMMSDESTRDEVKAQGEDNGVTREDKSKITLPSMPSASPLGLTHPYGSPYSRGPLSDTELDRPYKQGGRGSEEDEEEDEAWEDDRQGMGAGPLRRVNPAEDGDQDEYDDDDESPITSTYTRRAGKGAGRGERQKREWSWGWGALPRRRGPSSDVGAGQDEWIDPSTLATSSDSDEEGLLGEEEEDWDEDDEAELEDPTLVYRLSTCGLRALWDQEDRLYQQYEKRTKDVEEVTEEEAEEEEERQRWVQEKIRRRKRRVFSRNEVSQQVWAEDPRECLRHPDLVIFYQGSYYSWEALGPHLIGSILFGAKLSEDSQNHLPFVSLSPLESEILIQAQEEDDRRLHRDQTPIHALSVGEPRRVVSGQEGRGGVLGPPRRGWRAWLSGSGSTLQPPRHAKTSRPSSPLQQHQSTYGALQEADGDDDEEVKEHDALTAQKRSSTFPQVAKEGEGGRRRRRRGSKGPGNGRPRRWQYAKTLRLTSDQLKSLGLRRGANEVRFTVAASEGRVYCTSKIFLWPEDAKVVISDIDGTITKSDALGHIFNMVGKDWTHPGVAKLYTDIARNGYHFLYLTSRAIGQADATRGYLRSVEQGPFQLPDGPVIMSPDRLFTSLHREVIMRKPEVFKMACLRDIRRLFIETAGATPGVMETPFYAGFGNRITDAMSYRSVNVPTSRIFTIEYNGDVRLELATGFRSSYISLTDLVDQIFPSLQGGGAELMVSEYNDWNYWRPPLPSLDIDALLAEDQAETSGGGGGSGLGSVIANIRGRISPPPPPAISAKEEKWISGIGGGGGPGRRMASTGSHQRFRSRTEPVDWYRDEEGTDDKSDEEDKRNSRPGIIKPKTIYTKAPPGSQGSDLEVNGYDGGEGVGNGKGASQGSITPLESSGEDEEDHLDDDEKDEEMAMSIGDLSSVPF